MSEAEVSPSLRLQRSIAQSHNIDGPGFHSRVHPEFGKAHMINSQTPSLLILALHKALASRDLAVSWRHFNVGAALISLKASPSELSTPTGFNAKPEEDSQINIHAEQLALEKFDDKKGDLISMIAVVGETQSDTQSGQHMHTLHPCGLCRDAMEQHSAIDNDATLIVSALPTFRTIELYSLNALKRFHETNDNSGIKRFTLPALSLLEPFVPDPAMTSIRLAEDENSLEDERIWDDTVGAYLSERRIHLLIQGGYL